MPVGQVLSNSSLVGTLVFDTKSLNNTGIANQQIKPLDFGKQPPLYTPAPPKFGGDTEVGSFKSGLAAERISDLEKVSKPGENLTVAPPKENFPSDKGSLELAPSTQSYNFIGKLTSESSAATGSIFSAVA